MIKWTWLYFTTILVLLLFSDAHGQTTYFMSNQTIRDCEGILRDSEENEDFPGYYDHNENYVTTICVDNAAEITLTFTEFHIEEDFDFMYIYDGPDLSGNLLATYTGFGIPPSITISGSDCVTIHFTSDDNIAQFGWTLRWEVETEEPEPIDISPVADYSCEEPTFLLQLSAPVLCDSLNPSNLFLVGPGNASVQSVRPINCVDGVTDQFEITFAPVISISSNYQIRLIAYFRDACDEVHELISSFDFLVNDCPININFVADPACPGSCIDITAEVTGGDGNYSYFWTPAGGNSNTINVCPQDGDVISLRVVDGLGQSAVAQYTPEIFPAPVLLNIPSDTICRLRSQFNLQADPPGGTWTANGVHPNNSGNGLYQAWRNSDNPITIDQISYTDTNGCTVDTQMVVLFISVGNNDAECLDAPPFQVSGGSPGGGVWSGNGIDASGVFTPDQTGQFYVQYEAPNGCIWGKNVFVSDGITLQGPDTVCNTQGNFRITIDPPGGLWDNNPAINRNGDRVDINRSQLGSNQLIYRTEGGGCVDTFNYFVKRITLDNDNRTYCPDVLGNSLTIPFVPNIPGGQWQGGGIMDPVAGTIDVSNASAGDTYNLRYVADGCFVDATINMVVPNIDLVAEDTYCKSDAPILLEDLVDYSPDYAGLSGLSVLDDGNGNLTWDPSLSTGDSSFVRVSAHGCADSVALYFHPTSEIIQDRICQLDPPEYLEINPSFASATGPGVVFPDLALFDPSELDTGWVFIELQSEEGCINLDSIYITGKVEPSIESFQSYYCYRDTLITPTVDPPGGRIWLNDQPAQDFNPTLLDQGGHVLRYEYGDGNCESSVSASFFILPPLELEAIASVDTLCPGELVRLSAQPSGGDPSANFNITWGGQLGFGQVHYTSPTGPQLYTVTVDDGCSDPAMDSV
ncbi:MAG TPA: CUB domain-containing protein, partial [Saprospiraceae bacterium]|nr:CUB domain-containing protein [Saprospiraceae bacterium]